jgi:hypothetical protein
VGSPEVFHPVVQLGTVVTGVVRDSKGAPLANSRVFADNALTNAGMGAGLAADGTYTMLVMGPQWIKLQYVVSRDGAESLVVARRCHQLRAGQERQGSA